VGGVGACGSGGGAGGAGGNGGVATGEPLDFYKTDIVLPCIINQPLCFHIL